MSSSRGTHKTLAFLLVSTLLLVGSAFAVGGAQRVFSRRVTLKTSFEQISGLVVGAPVVKVGNLEPVREFVHVLDIVEAYARLLVKGTSGEAYNVASGQGISLEDLLFKLAEMAGVRPIVEADPELMRPADVPHLVGDATKLRAATGWAPRYSLDTTLRQVLDATTV